MDAPVETKKSVVSSNKKVIVVAAVIIALVIVAAVAAVLWFTKDSDDGKIDYAAEATVMLEQDALQAAFDEAMQNAADGNVGLRYQNDAYSDNGIDFKCRIINSATNLYDMFLTIYADAELTDQIYLSGLVPPGSGFENISLEHALDSGDHTVYVALTQVDTDEETGEQVIKHQVMHTMDFHVS